MKTPEISRLREAIAQARQEELDASRMAIALGDSNAPQKDVRYAQDREASARLKKHGLARELALLLALPPAA